MAVIGNPMGYQSPPLRGQGSGAFFQYDRSSVPALSAVADWLGRSRPSHRSMIWTSRVLEVDRKSTRLNSSHRCISYAVFSLKKKNQKRDTNDEHITHVVR